MLCRRVMRSATAGTRKAKRGASAQQLLEARGPAKRIDRKQEVEQFRRIKLVGMRDPPPVSGQTLVPCRVDSPVSWYPPAITISHAVRRNASAESPGGMGAYVG